MQTNFSAPILFLIFNRPDTTQRVFDKIKKQKPAKLYVASDGPRKNKEGEKELCDETRKIIKQVDWNCEVKTLFRQENLGCKKAVSSAIDWFFENEEMGIILEDDCLPDQSFFGYCAELLEKYRDDERIMMISGDNFQNGIKRGDGSYYFSKSIHIWGWATWKRAWKKYDADIKTFPLFKKQNRISSIVNGKTNQLAWLANFEAVFEKRLDTWDYQWTYAIWANGGLGILPNINLISNIGFRIDATHTRSEDNKYANMKTDRLEKIIHPTFTIEDKIADDYFFKKNMTLISLIKNKISQLIK